MAKIYFRRQATIPPMGTNGIATFCTSNQTFYLDGIPYGGGSGCGSLSALTMESFWGGKTEIPIEDGSANIDLTEFANADDVRQLLEDVFIIKQELEIDGPIDPSGDPRTAIDILNEDLTKVVKDLNKTKEKVALNENHIEKNTDAIQNLNNQLVSISGDTHKLEKKIKKVNQRVDDCVSEHELLKNEVLHHHRDIENIYKTYITGATINGEQGVVTDNVVHLTLDLSQTELSAMVFSNAEKIDAISGSVSDIKEELTDFESSVADDITSLSGAIDDRLEWVNLNISGKTVYLNDSLGKTSSIELPLDQVVSGGTYDAQTEELVLYLTSGCEIRIPVSGLVDTYKGDGTTIVLKGDTFSIASGVTENIKVNQDNILELSGKVDTNIANISTISGNVKTNTTNISTISGKVNDINSKYISGISVNNSALTITNKVAKITIPEGRLYDADEVTIHKNPISGTEHPNEWFSIIPLTDEELLDMMKRVGLVQEKKIRMFYTSTEDTDKSYALGLEANKVVQ